MGRIYYDKNKTTTEGELQRKEFVSTAVQAELRRELKELKERDNRRMPTWVGFVWGILFGFTTAAWWIE